MQPEFTLDPTPPKPAKQDPEGARRALHERGTKPWQLTPEAVVDTAKADLQRVELNAKIREARAAPDRKLRELGESKPREYAFLSIHVIEQESAASLLRTALQNRGAVMKDHKRGDRLISRDRLLLYEDPKLLKAAIKLAEAEENE